MTIVLLAICAAAVGACVALMYGVHNRFPSADSGPCCLSDVEIVRELHVDGVCERHPNDTDAAASTTMNSVATAC